MDGWMDRWMDEEYYLSKINPQRVARIVGIGPSMCVYTVYRYHDL